MKVLRKVQSLLFSMCALGSFQLFSMEIALHEKPKNLCDWKEVLFFVKAIQESRGMPEDISKVITQRIPALRMRDIYKKFDSFFHFDNGDYFQMVDDYNRNVKLFFGKYPKDYNYTKHVYEEFDQLYPNKIELCRKFDFIDPHDLLFFTAW